MISSSIHGSSQIDLHSDSFSSNYLHDLLQCDLERIRCEPDLQLAEQARLKSEIEQLAVSNYRNFIETSICLSQCRRETDNISSSLELLQALASDLVLKIKSYSSENSTQFTEATVQAALKECYPLLVNILDMPCLMEACIAEKAYDEALDIRDHAKALVRRNPDVKILSIIGAAVDKNTDLMVQDFFNILENVVELPVSLQTIGHIRRIGRYTEDEIQMLFLQRREVFLESKLTSETTSDTSALSSAVRYLDLIRINLFEIVTQFQAMFTKDNGLLQSWVSHRMENILDMLHVHLPLINNGSSIATLLEQAMYCGMSLGTIGIDFRAILVPIFHQKVCELFSQSINSSFQLFAKSLYSYHWIVDKESLEKVCISMPVQSSIAITPDLFLFPPLAILVNCIFEALNQIKECIFFYVQSDIASQLQELMLKCSSYLSCTPPEAQLAELCQAFCDIVLPICEQALAVILSVHVAIDREKILAPLKSADLYSIQPVDEDEQVSDREEQIESVLESPTTEPL